MDFISRYQKLNIAQKQAVDTIDGPVMVIAGPGTGKTELLSMRTATILKKTDTLPENILCLTFTESGATAMRERLATIIGPAAYKVAIHTFHSFGTEIINQHAAFFYNGARFQPSDELGSYELLRAIFDELDHKSPLAVMTNGEYTYLSDTLSTISELKRAGLTGDELRTILTANQEVIDATEPLLQDVFKNRLSKTTIAELQALLPTIQSVEQTQASLAAITSLSVVLADSLTHAASLADVDNSTKPLTAWRNTWMKKDDTGDFILKSRDRQAKLHEVAAIYDKYLLRMHEAALYDFDDMILRVVHALEVFPELRFNLQERYQYIMVDEFQDTNMAQMRILYSLTNNDANADQPNILVVGDDDQAIYSFQGADVGNIHNFRETFDRTQLIVLTDNYRSTSSVLTSARRVITLGEDRLETHLPKIDKTLTAHQPDVKDAVSLVELPAIHNERQWVVNAIKASIDSGTSPASIAVLARRHHELVALLPYFADANIAVNYERRDNVLDLEPIELIELIAHVFVALFEQRHNDANGLLPKLFAHPAFSIDPQLLWQVSLRAHANRQSWMEVIAATTELTPIHSWLIAGAKQVAFTPLEHMLDIIIGTPKEEADDSAFVSPLFDYYFATDKLETTPDNYLQALEGLQTIRTKLREYQTDKTPHLQSFLEFIRLHRQLDRPITSIRPKSTRTGNAVNLMTAHKSKGLEFNSVYVIGATDNSWGERVRTKSRLISYPENLPLAPAGDTIDERLRLFFVAMTRAKKHLTISYSTKDTAGKDTLRASFLANDSWQALTPRTTEDTTSLIHASQLEWYQPVTTQITASMKELLGSRLENYKLSSTHLANFLDVTRGGPQGFLLRNLLHFPQAMPAAAAYGSAIHMTLQRTHAHLSATGKHRPIEDILHDFEEQLQGQQLTDDDFALYLQKGSETLSAFLEQKYTTFTRDQKVELSFAHQNVYLGDAHLTGSLDLVDCNETAKTIVVTDYKTGKPASSWIGKTDYEKIKLHRYKQQLMFYHLLIGNSRDYHNYTVKRAVLQFVEPTTRGEIVDIEATFNLDELEQFTHLIHAVWRRIVDLDLPDISQFEQNYKGILAFEQSLIDE